MDKNIKCTNCNSVDLFLYNSEGPATTYVCRQCSHMEWYLNDDTLQLYCQHEKKEFEKEKFEKEKSELQNQINELQNIADDEHQTLKAIREAREKMKDLQEKLQNIDIEF